ncbi:MAG: hypothetical protein HYZ17_00975 [Betaproteobacteria bacterium]|nr:hypothetical protein [Betaproteobacteria bacterium]
MGLALASGLLLLALGLALRLGLADFTSLEARTRADEVLSQNTRLAPPEFVRLRDGLLQAAHKLPEDPQAWERLGALALQRATGPRADPILARPYYRQALEHLRRAAALRPTSPYTQANIALAKLGLGEIDAEFDRALLAAERNGPWEPAVHYVMLEAGMTHWAALRPELQAQVATAAERALVLERKRVLAFAHERGQMPWLCARLAQRPAECGSTRNEMPREAG